MAIAILAQDGQQFTGSAASRSIPFTVPQGADCLLVSVTCQDFGGSGSVAQVDWDGDTGFVRAVHRESLNAGHHAEAWILTGPAAGSGNITVTYVGNRGDDIVYAHALSGIDAADPVGASDTASHDDQTVALSLTTEGAGSFLLFVAGTGGGDVWPMTIGTAGWTADLNSTTDAGSGSNADSSSVVGHATGGAASTLESFSGDWAVADPTWNGAFVLVEIKAAAGGGTDATATPAGVEGTGAVGSVVVRLDSTAGVTGVSGSGAVGSVGVAAGAGIAVAVAGPFGTALVGAVAARLGATAAVSGLGATTGLGTAAFFEWKTHETPAAAWVEEGAASAAWLDAPAAEGPWS